MKRGEYRARAEEMRRLAERAADEDLRIEYARMAAAWIELAETQERIVRTEAPPPQD